MKQSHFHIKTTKTARIVFEGDKETATTCNILLHGYGQLAQDYLSVFAPLFNAQTFWIAPEGLSKFYLKSISGKIGASWMTKEDRITEINDYISYLDQVYSYVTRHSFRQINVIAFSQGVPTACRWVVESQPEINKLILNSSIFPRDMAMTHFKKRGLYAFDLHFAYGQNDKLLSQEHIEEIEKMREEFPSIQIHKFGGRHEINLDIIRNIMDA